MFKTHMVALTKVDGNNHTEDWIAGLWEDGIEIKSIPLHVVAGMKTSILFIAATERLYVQS